jgi:hypothetical protein
MVGGTGTSRRQVVETVESQCGLPTNICSQAGKHQIQNCLAKPAQQSVQWTVGILRHFRVFSIPEQNLGLGVLSTPAPPPLTKPLGGLPWNLFIFIFVYCTMILYRSSRTVICLTEQESKHCSNLPMEERKRL